MKKILFVTNDAWFFASHRQPIASEVMANDIEAVLAAKPDESVSALEQTGCRFVPWNLSPRGKSVLGEIKAVVDLFRIVKREKPDLIHLITIKPVLYGGIVARILRVPSCVFAISGLGSVFAAESSRAKVLKAAIKSAYSFAIGHPNSVVIFQNIDDEEDFHRLFSTNTVRSTIIRGSGVDLRHFPPRAQSTDDVVVTLAARLLKDKGINEFVEAVALLKARGSTAVFQIAGDNAGEGNPSEFSAAELAEFRSNPHIKMLGHCDDIPALFAESSIVVLPSYREGLPKVLIEAGAASRAVVTTDVPGCRAAVTKDRTALLCPSKDAEALAQAMEELINNREKRVEFGTAGRQLVQDTMTIEIVVQQHLAIYSELSTTLAQAIDA